MTIYAGLRKATVVEANLDESTVTVQYHDDEFDEETTAADHKDALAERHRDPFDLGVVQLDADGGLKEVAEAIAELPDEDIHGEGAWLDATLDDGGDA